MGFPKYTQRYFFARSSKNWTLLFMSTSTLHILSYNSVIDGFAPRASCGTILERDVILYYDAVIQNFETSQKTFNITVSQDQVQIGHCRR
jgi:hypothetical protein